MVKWGIVAVAPAVAHTYPLADITLLLTSASLTIPFLLTLTTPDSLTVTHTLRKSDGYVRFDPSVPDTELKWCLHI